MRNLLKRLVVVATMLTGSLVMGEPQNGKTEKPVEPQKSRQKKTTLTAQEKEVLEQLELLQNLDLLEQMDLVRDLPLLGGSGGDQ